MENLLESVKELIEAGDELALESPCPEEILNTDLGKRWESAYAKVRDMVLPQQAEDITVTVE